MYVHVLIFCVQGVEAKSKLNSTIVIVKVKLSPYVESDPKASFSIATTPWCRKGRFSIPWIAPLYL